MTFTNFCYGRTPFEGRSAPDLNTGQHSTPAPGFTHAARYVSDALKNNLYTEYDMHFVATENFSVLMLPIHAG